MNKNNLDMIILTSMHNVAYYSGFIYCSFSRHMDVLSLKKKFLQFKKILMLVNRGEDHIVII